MLGLGGLDRPTDSLRYRFFFFFIYLSGTEENSCGFMWVVSCNVLGSMSFRDFFIVAPTFYEVIELTKKSLGKNQMWERWGETIHLFSYFLFPIFIPQNPVVVLHSHTHLKISYAELLSFELCTVSWFSRHTSPWETPVVHWFLEVLP